jgi:hypothetical protein
MTAHVAKPPMKYTVLFGWEDRNGLVPVYFKGQMSSDFLQDLVCTCKGKSVTVLFGEIDGDWMKKKKKLRSYVIIFISISRYC